jgi:hypothetical protein
VGWQDDRSYTISDDLFEADPADVRRLARWLKVEERGATLQEVQDRISVAASFSIIPEKDSSKTK